MRASTLTYLCDKESDGLFGDEAQQRRSKTILAVHHWCRGLELVLVPLDERCPDVTPAALTAQWASVW